jgi:hypothetical protein
LSGLGNAWTMSHPRFGSNGRDGIRPGREGCRSYLASSEPLGSLYRPRIRIPERYRGHFEPLYVTDPDGELHDDLIGDAASLLPPTGKGEAATVPTYNAIDIS